MALITGLLLLAAISLLALAGTSGMILQKHMAANFKHGALALQNADLAQSEGRAWLFSRANHEREAGCVADCLLPAAIHPAGELPVLIEFESPAWWQLNAVAAGVNPATGLDSSDYRFDDSAAPRWLIEELYFQPQEPETSPATGRGVGYYRIFGHGMGGNPHSVAVTEAIVARPWGDGIVPQTWPATGDGVRFCEQLEDIAPPLTECGTQAWRQRR
jgi:Tfp pilus assembly protein PilX